MNFMIQAIFFAVIAYLVFYVPGKTILRFFKYDFPLWEEAALAVTCGISIFLLASYSLSWLKLDPLYGYLVIAFSLVQTIRHATRPSKISLKNVPYLELLIIFIGSGAMLFITAKSGLEVPRGMIFYGINSRDGIYHMSLVTSMMREFPPMHPELAGISLRGYHFFYDFLLAEIAKLYSLNYIDLIFRNFAAFIALLYGLSAFAFARFLRMPKFAAIIFLFLVYFAGGLELFWKPFWGPGAIYDTAINPLLVNIVNPPLLISVTFCISLYILLFSKNKSLILPVIILGILPEIKVYAALLAYVGVFVIALLALIRNRSRYYFKVLFLSGLISIFVYAPFNLGAGGLAFAPFALYRHTIESFSSRWGLEMQVYSSAGNILKIILLYAVAVVVYFLPTLGLRVLSITEMKNTLKKSFYTDGYVFLGTVIITSFFLTTFFVQTVDPLNIVQFLWVSYILLLIPTALAINSITQFLFKGKAYGKIVVFIFIAILSLPHLFDIWNSYSKSVYFIDRERLNIASFIKNNVPQDKGLIVLNVDSGRDIYAVPEIAALSLHPTYYESTITTFVPSQELAVKRKGEVNDLAVLLKSCTGSVGDELKSAMVKNNNAYILTLSDNPCLLSLSGFSLVAQSGHHSLFKIK